MNVYTKNAIYFISFDSIFNMWQCLSIFQVNYLGEQTTFSVQQVMAMMLTKLKEISESNLRIKVQDCVLSVSYLFNNIGYNFFNTFNVMF